MGFGSFLTSAADDCSLAAFVADSSPVQKKRLLENDVHDDAEPSALKVAKTKPVEDDSPLASTRASSFGLPSEHLSTSEHSLTDAEISLPGPLEHPIQCQDHGRLDSAVEAARCMFTEAWVAFAIERDSQPGKGDEAEREDYASKASELMVAERYEEMKVALLNLLPWLGPMQPDGQGKNYQVVEFSGCHPPRHLKKGQDDSHAVLKAELDWLRSEPRGRAWEACCAVMAALSTRTEKSWLEANDVCPHLEEHLSTLPGCKSKKSAQRKLEICKFLEKEASSVRGFFAHYMVSPTTNLRIAFAPGVPMSMPALPASLVITNRLPLWDALVSLDGDCPLKGEAKSRTWCMAAGRQFAFQLANIGVPERPAAVSRKARAAGSTLQHDAKLLKLLRSKKPVVQLEVVAALAPRDVSKQQGLGEVVKAELAAVMQEAKRRGEAVVFCLGSASPHLLAEKVYLRKPISDNGLRCGYLRWRASADAPWARETEWSDRTTLCLQMP